MFVVYWVVVDCFGLLFGCTVGLFACSLVDCWCYLLVCVIYYVLDFVGCLDFSFCLVWKVFCGLLLFILA